MRRAAVVIVFSALAVEAAVLPSQAATTAPFPATADAYGSVRNMVAAGQRGSVRRFGRLVGVSRGTVGRALEVGRGPKYQRPPVGSSFDPFAAQVRALLLTSPRMPASALAERVGWTGASSVFRAKVDVLRPEQARDAPSPNLSHCGPTPEAGDTSGRPSLLQAPHVRSRCGN